MDIYVLSDNSFKYYDYLQKAEVISHYDEEVLKKIYIPNILDKIYPEFKEKNKSR